MSAPDLWNLLLPSCIDSDRAGLLFSFLPYFRMGATVFVQPLDLVKNRMQLSGEGAKTREYKTSFHALTSILKAEGLKGIYTGYWDLTVGREVVGWQVQTLA